MTKGFGRVFGLAVAWALIYALPAVPIEGLSNLRIDFSFTHAVDMWPQTLGIPGFIGGLFFGALLAIAGQLRGFEELPLGRLLAWGTGAGLLVGGFVMLMITPEPLHVTAWVVGIATLLGAVSGPASALAFRYLARRGGMPAAQESVRG